MTILSETLVKAKNFDGVDFQTDASGNINAWIMHAYGSPASSNRCVYYESEFYSMNTMYGVIGRATGKFKIDQISVSAYKVNNISCSTATKPDNIGKTENPAISDSSWWTVRELP